ncbi:Flp pilus assembly complex ATPase component TadA [bacterium]|nr:Flp pilus assembly complex ATPase component TadA [bacterium]
MERKGLGQILLEKGLITTEQLESALIQQITDNRFLGEVLVEKKIVTKEQILECLTEQKKAATVNLQSIRNIKPDIVRLIPENIAKRYNVIAIAKEDERLVIAMNDPTNIVAIDAVSRMTDSRVKVLKADLEDIKDYLEKYYADSVDLSKTASALEALGTDENGQIDVQQLKVASEDVPIVQFVSSLFLEAIEKRATDIHLEPQETKVSVRFRVDGILQRVSPPPKSSYTGIVTRLKILSNLDIGERRLPQDGRTKIKTGTREIDVRVSTLPAIHGEKIVMRLLDRQSLVKSFKDAGFETEEETAYMDGLRKPYGMLMVTGPTGSGKTTTLYTGLSSINTPDKNIITIEDPVEYEIEGINQVQIKPKIGLTFAAVLRTFLRQDPDIIMVGEIRDLETAQIAIQAALTGHLVLSTIHTNDTVSTLSRFNFMGVPTYLIAEAMDLIISQRLVRRICLTCKEEDKEGKKLLEKVGINTGRHTIYKGVGCEDCSFSGYFGRTAIFEILKVDKDIRTAIIEGKKEEELRVICKKKGMPLLRDAALKKVLDGITSAEELIIKTTI